MTVGSDHDLIEQVDEWGASRSGRAYLSYSKALQGAAAGVSHGGPGTITLALSHGKRPIVVARRSDLDEHADDHQLTFPARMGSDGTILLADMSERLFASLDSALYSPADFPIAVRRDSARTATRAEEFVERLVRARGKQRARRPLH